MSFVIAIVESRLVRNFAVVAAGCLLNAGVAMGMPMPHGEAAAPGGTITFSGAIMMGTCASPAAGDLAGARESAPARGECHSGANRTGYRFSANEVGDRPGVRLLEYAKDRYGKATVVTYVYD